jgi:mRNA-degrading endonuclease RelE of RelBE toxin-antitoxin system
MHPDVKRKVKAGLQTILDNPGAGKALKDELAGLRSLRVSSYRIVYKVKEFIIEIEAIGPRERIYEDTLRQIKKIKKA